MGTSTRTIQITAEAEAKAKARLASGSKVRFQVRLRPGFVTATTDFALNGSGNLIQGNQKLGELGGGKEARRQVGYTEYPAYSVVG